MGWALGIEQNPRRFKRAGRHHYNTCIRLTMLVRDAVDVVHTFGATARVHQQVADDGIADQREFAGASGGGKSHGRAVEIGSRIAAALALIAIVARRAPAVWNGQIRDAIRPDTPAKLALDDLPGSNRSAGQVHRRQKFSIGKLWQAFLRSADADVAFD